MYMKKSKINTRVPGKTPDPAHNSVGSARREKSKQGTTEHDNKTQDNITPDHGHTRKLQANPAERSKKKKAGVIQKGQ
jgi:hypothetical protein